MTTLTDFLLQRIAEDEAVARRAIDPSYGTDNAGHWVFVEFPYEGEWPRNPSEARGESLAGSDWCIHANRHDPARVLAECEAKRRIVELHTGVHECVGEKYGDPQACVYVSPGFMHEDDPTLRLLTLPYAGHPEYDERWRP